MALNAARIIERLENEQFTPGGDPQYRAGWNACARHVLAWLRVDAGLADLATAPIRVVAWDMSDVDESGGEG